MKNTDILEVLAKKDDQAFQALMEKMEVSQLTEKEEADFVRKAPTKWLEIYFSKVYPYPRSERCLMTNLKYQKVLKICEKHWGFNEDNLLWAFQNLSLSMCEVLINCLEHNPGAEVEKAMLSRRNADLLMAWLRQFKTLSEDAERLIEENLSFQSLKTAYIEHQMR